MTKKQDGGQRSADITSTSSLSASWNNYFPASFRPHQNLLSAPHKSRIVIPQLTSLFFYPHAGGVSLHLHPTGQFSQFSRFTRREKMAEMRMALQTVTSSMKRPA